MTDTPLTGVKVEFENYLANMIDLLPDSEMKEAMAYSLLAPGKRVRPMLLFAAVQDYGLDPVDALPMAAAIEMIHTYSLIHDDLPEMDNDDLRRGLPTCHKIYGQDIALLAGDALQSYAFEMISRIPDAEKSRKLTRLAAKMAGPAGMCLGQNLDLKASGSTTLTGLEEIEKYKTGCLIELPLCAAAILAGKEEDLQTMQKLGKLIGIQFQIQDDLLEKTSTPEIMGKSLSDQRNDKATALSFYSLEEGQKLVDEYDRKIHEQLDALHLNSQALNDLVDKLKNRSR